MKAFKILLIFSFGLLFIQCKEKVEQKKMSSIDPDTTLDSPQDDGTISVTVYDYKNNTTIDDVQIEIKTAGVTTGHDKTDTEGQVTLYTVEGDKEYIFRKRNFNPQEIQFNNYKDIDKVSLYLIPTNTYNSPEMNIKGVIYNSAGQTVSGVIVRSDNNHTTSQENGTYSLDIQSEEGNFPLNFGKAGVQGDINMNSSNDTVVVDVYINGFNADTITVKKQEMSEK